MKTINNLMTAVTQRISIIGSYIAGFIGRK